MPRDDGAGRGVTDGGAPHRAMLRRLVGCPVVVRVAVGAAYTVRRWLAFFFCGVYWDSLRFGAGFLALKGCAMPSWNIHIAQTECLLSRAGAVAHAVRDCNVFLFGNLVPDIYVGYMVPDLPRRIRYTKTHFADPGHMPRPRAHEFWDGYVAPLLGRVRPAGRRTAESRESLQTSLDLALGAWAHLLADNIWNTHSYEVLERMGEKPSDGFRIKKQADFDWFGKTLPISAVPVATDELYRAAAEFGQYTIDRQAVDGTVAVAERIVRDNPGVPGHPPYRLLSDEFFERVFTEVIEETNRQLDELLG